MDVIAAIVFDGFHAFDHEAVMEEFFEDLAEIANNRFVDDEGTGVGLAFEVPIGNREDAEIGGRHGAAGMPCGPVDFRQQIGRDVTYFENGMKAIACGGERYDLGRLPARCGETSYGSEG